MIVWDISLGTIVTTATILFTVAGFYWKQTLDAQQIKEDVQEIKGDLKVLNKVIIDMAVQTQRLDNQAERLTLFERRFDKVLEYIKIHGMSVD